MESKAEAVSSPLASGGAGTYFEQHVSAFFLALLAVRGIPPVLKDSQLIKVEFQTEMKLWNTDDILIVAQNNAGVERKLAIQVKRQFVVSDTNGESKKAILDFWKDFKNSAVFNPVTDCLGLCVQKGTNTVINIFSGLLDNARGASDGTSFRNRLNVTGAISKKAKNQAGIIKNLIKEHADTELNDDELREFLSCIHVFQLDLNTDSSISEGLIRSLLSSCCSAGNPIDSAAKTWGELIALVTNESTGVPIGKSYVLNELPETIRKRHDRPIDINSLRKLADHGGVVVDAIGDTISGNIAINRDQLYGQLLNSIHQNRVLVISGLAGSGKSALAKALFSELTRSRYCFAFRAEEFANVHIDDVIAKLDASVSSTRIFELLASQGEIVFFVESAERLLEATTRDAFTDFLRLT